MTTQKRSFFSYIPGYHKNAILQVIIVFSTAFVAFNFIRAIMLMIGLTEDQFVSDITAYVALPTVQALKGKVWVLLTYGLVDMGFFKVLTNMIWLYAFGNLVQNMVGYKQVWPIFLYSILAGGIFYELSQLIPGNAFAGIYYVYGCQAGIMGMAAAALTITPGYRFYLGDRFSIPIAVVVGIFAFLMLLNTGMHLPLILLLAGGSLMGFGYIRLLQNGYRPGAWMYNLMNSIESTVTPNEHTAWKKNSKKRADVLRKMYEPKQGITQKNIDEILDKINQRGYNSLTKEEKETLFRAGKDE
ncbi:MAG: rhomboid family intramembrane serine protease [Flavipsychrobacter sp.]